VEPGNCSELPTSAFQEQRPGPNFAGPQPHTNRSLEGHTNNFAPFAYSGSKTNPHWLAGALQRVPKLEAPLPMTFLGLTSTQALSPYLRATFSGSLLQSPPCCNHFQRRASQVDQSHPRHPPTCPPAPGRIRRPNGPSHRSPHAATCER
jgi:hypothetical protein